MTEENTKEVAAGIIIYRKTGEGPRFLLLYHGGKYWNFPKGKPKEREGSFRTALREVWEETGITEKDLSFRDWFKVQDSFSFQKEKKKILKTVTYYLAETRRSEVILKKKHEKQGGERHHGYAWFLFRDAYDILSAPNLKRNLKKANEIIIRRKGFYRNEKNKEREGRHIQASGQDSQKSQFIPRGGKRPQ